MLIPQAVVQNSDTGRELGMTEFTADVNVTATTEGTADVVVTAPAVQLDGATKIIVEFFSPTVASPGGAAGRAIFLILFAAKDGAAAAALGRMDVVYTDASARVSKGSLCRRIYTPTSGSYVYSMRSYVTAGTGVVEAFTGGPAVDVPGYIRVTKA